MFDLRAKPMNKELQERIAASRAADERKRNMNRPITGHGGLTIDDAASYAGVSRWTIYRWARVGKIQGAYKEKSRAGYNRWWIPVSGLKERKITQRAEFNPSDWH